VCEGLEPGAWRTYAGLCGWTLARAHARSGDRIALASCVGGSGQFDQAIADETSCGKERKRLVFPSYAAAASLVTVPWMFFGELS